MLNKQNLRYNRLYCPPDEQTKGLFFSLVDYRNNYFTSNDPKNVLGFYDGFENRDQLIQWMRERPKGVHTIYEVDGDKEIIVVIPTADYNGKFAKECRENIFKGLYIIFVESGGRGDFYFNYAHNCNVGIKKAMEYNPKWIVLSGDDMYKIDGPDKLREEILINDNRKVGTLYTDESKYHSRRQALLCQSLIGKLYTQLGNTLTKRGTGLCRTPEHLDTFNFTISCAKVAINERYSIYHRIRSSTDRSLRSRIENKILYRKILEGTFFLDFGIFSSVLMKELHNSPFMESFVNGSEDTMLSLEIIAKGTQSNIIDYRIGDFVGSTLGNDDVRSLRDMAGFILLDSLVERFERNSSMSAA